MLCFLVSKLTVIKVSIKIVFLILVAMFCSSAPEMCTQLRKEGGVKVFTPFTGICYSFNMVRQSSKQALKAHGSGYLHRIAFEFNIESKQ